MNKPSFSSMLIWGGLAVHLCTAPAHAGIQEGAVALAVGNGTVAIKELTPLAEEGNALAMGLLARIYWVGGTGLPKNRELAADYAKKALPGLIKEAEAENGLAQSTLSVLYREGNGTEKDCAKAVDWAKRSANQNDPFGLSALGNLFDAVGSCLPKDAEQAAQLYRKAAEQGHSGAQYNLGWRYGNGTGLAKDDQQAESWFRKSADQGVAVAQHALGVMYANGRGVQKDEQQAVYWYAKAAEQGDARAQGDLGFMYANGRGIEKNDLLAFQWLRKSADQGLAVAQQALGSMYADGRGVAKDDRQAVTWFQKSADQGNAIAQRALGVMYANGRGIAKDEQLAVSWYQKAAEQGDSYAQANLGFMLSTGQGVVKDDSLAAQWYQKAAEQGDPRGQFNLSYMYRRGLGVVKDEQQAVQWLRKAADQGLVEAQTGLGVMYANGSGVTRDSQLAYYWWLLASAQGNEAAKTNRDRVERLLTAEQRAEAQAAAREWKPNSGTQPKAEPSEVPPNEARPAPSPATPSLDSTGTGWAVTRTQLVTNAHVVDGCSRLEAKGLGPVRVQAVDVKSDLALLTVPNNPVVATLRGNRLRQGDAVTVIGYPLANMLANGVNVTAGNVSALSGVQNDTRHIQITAPVQPGNSGGPLLDASGHVVGVVVSKLNALKVAKATGDIPQNVNFAVSLFTLQGFLEANSVDYTTTPSSKNMTTADVAAIGKPFTVLLECYK